MRLISFIDAQSARLDQAGVSFGHGTTNAFDEAAWLVLWALKLPLDALDEHLDRSVSDGEAEHASAWVTRRIETRLPTAYLTGEAWLQGVPFHIDARSIVPRSFIAELIADGGFDAWLGDRTRRVLDLCTGNGSLAVLAALAWPEVQVDAADVSESALALAQRNVERHDLTARVTLHHGDLFDGLSGPYDLIVCNPPYVNAQAMADLPAEYRAEPALALDGNVGGSEDGLDLVRRILADAPLFMTPDAVLVLEIGNERPHFDAAFPGLDVVWLATSAGDDQVLLVTRAALLA